MTKTEEAIKRGKKIFELRKSKGISRRGLAKNINISDTALANIENGETKNITIELGKGIAIALGISFNELFEIESPNISYKIELEDEIKRLSDNVKRQERMLELQDKMIKMLEKSNKEYQQAYAVSERVTIIGLEELLNASEGEKLTHAELMSIVQPKAIARVKEEFPDFDFDIPPFLFSPRSSNSAKE